MTKRKEAKMWNRKAHRYERKSFKASREYGVVNLAAYYGNKIAAAYCKYREGKCK